MPRGRKPKGQVETALVTRPVVDAEFVGETYALATALASTQEMLTEIVGLMKASYADMVMSQKIMADSFTDSLKERIDLFKAKEELLDKREERKAKRKKEEDQRDFYRSIANDARVLLPQLMNRLGKNPTVSAPEAALLKPLIESLASNPERFQRILNMMTPSEQAALAQVLKAIPDEPGGDIGKDPPPNGATH